MRCRTFLMVGTSDVSALFGFKVFFHLFTSQGVLREPYATYCTSFVGYGPTDDVQRVDQSLFDPAAPVKAMTRVSRRWIDIFDAWFDIWDAWIDILDAWIYIFRCLGATVPYQFVLDKPGGQMISRFGDSD